MGNEIESFKKYLTDIIPMQDDVFNLCLPFLHTVKLEKGDYFVVEGRVCNKIAFIHTGLFRIYYLKDGIEVNTCFCKENSISSSFESFINHSPSKEFIQAIEISTIITLSQENLSKLYNLNPKWQSLSRLLTEKECLRLSNRVAALNFETAKEKYKNLLSADSELIQRVSIQHIASYIGVSRETLSRIRSKIASE